MGLTAGSPPVSADPLAPLDALRILDLSVTAEAEDPVELPDFSGSTLRGAFGHAFKRTVCVIRDQECGTCRLRDACSSPYLFDTPPAAGARRLRGVPNAPHPYRIVADEMPHAMAAGERFQFGLVLVGRAVELLPLAWMALLLAGDRGLTARRQRFSIERIVASTTSGPVVLDDRDRRFQPDRPFASVAARTAALDLAGDTRVRFRSPVRLTSDGRPAREVPFELLIRTLLRRASALLEFHEGVDLDLDYREWIARAREVETVSADLTRQDRVRYSARQGRTMNLFGLTGHVIYRGELAPFAPLLALGELVGVGKGTTFGLGSMGVEPVTESA